MSKIKKIVVGKWRLLRSQKFPIQKIIGKHLVKSGILHHQELLDKYDEHGRSGYDWTQSRYFIGSVFPDREKSFMFPCLPTELEREPVWWMMPWAFHPAKKRISDEAERAAKTIARIGRFFDLYESIKSNGYKDAQGGAITGYLLQHPEHGVIFNQIDGHHRLAILNHLMDKGLLDISEVAIFPLATMRRELLICSPCFAEGVEKGYFTHNDAFSLFDHCFSQLNGANTENVS